MIAPEKKAVKDQPEIQNAFNDPVKVLAKAVMDDPANSDHIVFNAFVAWATGKGWSMPEWMLAINTSLPSESSAPTDTVPEVECDQDAHERVTIPPVSPTHTAKAGLRKHPIASAFDGIYWNEDRWIEYLGDCPGWLESARSTPGKPGKGGDALWNPAAIATQLHDVKGIDVRVLSSVFRNNPILQPWVDDWKEAKDNFRD